MSALLKIFEANGDSYRAAAARLGYDQGYLHRICNGAPLSAKLAMRVNEAYDLTEKQKVALFREIKTISNLDENLMASLGERFAELV